MKTIAAATLLAALAGFATSARADHSRVTVTFGANYSAPGYYSAPGSGYYSAPGYYPAPGYTEAPRYVEAPRGHWEDVCRRDWIPARWVISRDRWGRPIRVFEQGHAEIRTERVWVGGERREPAYGYGYRTDGYR